MSENGLLAGRYEVLDRIGAGGMASVWRARDTVLARSVAIKVVLEQLSDDASFRDRLRIEAQHTAALSHPNIVTLFDWGIDHTSPFLVMELVDGSSLRGRLRQLGRLSLSQTRDLIRQLLAALQHAHERGIVHRDIKPENILLTRPSGSGELVKVTDFGISTALFEPGAADTSGSAAYMAPEQAAGTAPSPRADVYAVGRVMLECLVGHSAVVGEPNGPSTDPSWADERPDVPVRMWELIDRACAVDPSRRFPSASAMAVALATVADASMRPVTPDLSLSVTVANAEEAPRARCQCHLASRRSPAPTSWVETTNGAGSLPHTAMPLAAGVASR